MYITRIITLNENYWMWSSSDCKVFQAKRLKRKNHASEDAYGVSKRIETQFSILLIEDTKGTFKICIRCLNPIKYI